jgi:hypothetical protein
MVCKMKTIDITPTWSGVLPLLLAALEDGGFEARNAAMAELCRMAALADEYNAQAKQSAPKDEEGEQ